MESDKNANCSVQALSTLVKSEKSEVTENQSAEKLEEAKLFAKYPQVAKNMQMSQFLQKRLQQRKYFDSGDYNMAKAKGLKLNTLPATPSSVEIRAPRLSVIVDERDGSTSPTGMCIPTPDSIPHRKSSIVSELVVGTASSPIVQHQPQH
ncbi:cAMP-regulated phosphoprotein 19 [Trichinella pseudospiralis]|uniref:cAMP-regulated phosphoprotein 19 n=2 Tax=Trichinella pseudospiralis TaxID=6337 RepID=A0A0V0YBI6_TRIPS|nr:cAMP-regulated phosphoprotein 19 [Trichinella pseudospiralis]KRY71205.1 cAMP-regulated phosphoprotein 19 [Trichinella pseudospiralis]KRY82798.1 cAMP-regulated phosphoprotein 19 [Trichinella pseudospiralis]KRZ22915.1 cAMP-regulated phosphoprotein 19 [Trichinella pseudospiralis]KRZ39731.1 cAMP-regulated phosphoprotein 19 [Trichinella pseudospiralis]